MGKHVGNHLITCDNLFLRYEFVHNEFVTSVDCIPLETQGTETGIKEFIAVSTTINRGEDLAVKGAVSIACDSNRELRSS